MTIALLRHGVAEDASEATGWRDEPRALTADGRRRMRAAAAGIAALGLEFDAVMTSPLARCAQTAEIVCDRIGGTPRHDERLRPGMDVDGLLSLAMEHPLDARLLVCGHQPDLSHAAAELIGGGAIDFKKGALALIQLDVPRPGAGVLRGLYPPALLRAVGGASED